MSGGWDLALDAMTTLQHSFKTADGQRYLENVAKSMAGMEQHVEPDGGGGYRRTVDRFNVETGEYDRAEGSVSELRHSREVIAAAMSTVRNSEPVWVNDDVVQLVEVASDPTNPKPFKPEALYLDDLFLPWGFCLFERPLTHNDVRGMPITYRAFSWGITSPPDSDVETGIVVAIWSHRADGDGYHKPNEFPMIGGSPLTLTHTTVIPFGDDRMLADPPTHAMMRQLQVLWRLAKQEIAVPGREQVGRATWKRAAEWKQIKHVVVLRLRRVKVRKSEDGEEHEVPWSHRFLVHGHWRNQWYPSLKAHRQIWIETYVKGDESLPLVVKKRAIEFTR